MELVLNTFGTMLNRDNECFVVSNDTGRQRVPVEGITSILVCKGVSLTSDALSQASTRCSRRSLSLTLPSSMA